MEPENTEKKARKRSHLLKVELTVLSSASEKDIREYAAGKDMRLQLIAGGSTLELRIVGAVVSKVKP